MAQEQGPAWGAAVDDLESVQRAGQVAALLVAAHDSGLLDLLAAGVSAGQAAQATGVTEGRAAAGRCARVAGSACR